jgi:hypothetical protein
VVGSGAGSFVQNLAHAREMAEPPLGLYGAGASIDAPEFEAIWEGARQRGFQPTMLSKEQLQEYCELGFTVVDQGCPPDMLELLRDATARVIAKSRALEWPNPRWCRGQDGEPIEGRPNPDDIWGASYLLHPTLAEPVFLQYMASPHVLDVVGDILLLPQSERAETLELQLVNLLCEPRDADHSLPWHRDAFVGREDCDPPAVEERRKLESRNFGADSSTQWNCALFEDRCLYVVPRSHRRLRTSTEAEVSCLLYDKQRRGCVHIEGEIAVHLKPGQAVYFQSFLLHRGIYPTGSRRSSIHACMGHAGRRRSIDANDYMASAEFEHALPEALRPFWENRYSPNAIAGRTATNENEIDLDWGRMGSKAFKPAL